TLVRLGGRRAGRAGARARRERLPCRARDARVVPCAVLRNARSGRAGGGSAAAAGGAASARRRGPPCPAGGAGGRPYRGGGAGGLAPADAAPDSCAATRGEAATRGQAHGVSAGPSRRVSDSPRRGAPS